MLAFWIVLVILCVIAEAITEQLVSIWFALGAVVALIANLAFAAEWLQFTLFLAVSFIALLATRPLVKKYLYRKRQPTNADRVIGTQAVVLETIDNIAGKGLVKVNGMDWTARSEDDTLIPQGSMVTVSAIEGVKVIVNPCTTTAP